MAQRRAPEVGDDRRVGRPRTTETADYRTAHLPHCTILPIRSALASSGISVDPLAAETGDLTGVSRRQNVPKFIALRARRLIEVTVEPALRLNRRLRAPTIGHNGPLENPRKILDVRLRL